MNYLESKLITFEKALNTLKEALEVKKPSKLEKDGAIQRYEYCFELSWKTTKIYLESIGITKIASPKACYKQAFINQIIKKEDIWLEMINSRNLTVHTYNESFANILFEKLETYYKVMQELLIELKNLE